MQGTSGCSHNLLLQTLNNVDAVGVMPMAMEASGLPFRVKINEKKDFIHLTVWHKI